MTRLLRLLIVLIIICMFYPSHQTGGSHLSGWHRNPQCKYQLIKVLQTFIKANKMNQNQTGNWSVYLPCGYNNAEKEFHEVKSTDKDQKIFIIKGGDNLSRKDVLWKNLRKQYGRAAGDIMPESYLLHDEQDVQRLNREYDPRKVYILKKNIQRQQGLKMSKNRDELVTAGNSGYVIAQEMLQDPYLVDKRKTNCRVYLLVVCIDGNKKGYLYNNGFMYYTPQDFRVGSMEPDRVITAGLSTDRRDNEFYRTHPLTIQEFQNIVGPDHDLFERAGKLLARVLTASSPNFCNTGHLKNRTTFQLFGCDIAYNNRLQPQLIEINKGPDLTSKTHAESALKDDMITSMFKVVGVPVTGIPQGKFDHIWSS